VKRSHQDKNRKFDLVIFDCDGVLVDSEVISCRVHAEVLTRHGYPVSAEQVRERFLGRWRKTRTLKSNGSLDGRSPQPTIWNGARR
jgi:beta-phosphoglucomutase-like phosphatase (HAD superfamily)